MCSAVLLWPCKACLILNCPSFSLVKSNRFLNAFASSFEKEESNPTLTDFYGHLPRAILNSLAWAVLPIASLFLWMGHIFDDWELVEVIAGIFDGLTLHHLGALVSVLEMGTNVRYLGLGAFLRCWLSWLFFNH